MSLDRSVYVNIGSVSYGCHSNLDFQEYFPEYISGDTRLVSMSTARDRFPGSNDVLNHKYHECIDYSMY